MIWFLLACQAEEKTASPTPAEAAEQETIVDDEGPYLLDDESQQSTVDIPALENDINDLFSHLFSFRPQRILDSYQTIISHATSDCPRWFSNADGSEYWYDYCTTADGYSFDGYGTRLMDISQEDEYGTYWTGVNFWGIGTVSAPDGTTVKTTGSIFTRAGAHSNGTSNYQASIAAGSSLSTSAIAWENNTPESAIYTTYNTVGHQYTAVFGLYTTEAITVLFEGVELMYQNNDICQIEPLGSLSVFVSEVGWLDIEFDREGDLFTPATSACDGCGSLYRKGNLIGEICLDFSMLFDWDASTWE